MKLLRLVALSILLTIAVFAGTFYVACTTDKCKGVACKNNGVCMQGACSCTFGYTGERCQTLTFAGTWDGADYSPLNTDTFAQAITIGQYATYPDTVVITLSNNLRTPHTVHGTLSPERFTISYYYLDTNATSVDTFRGRFMLYGNYSNGGSNTFNHEYVISYGLGGQTAYTGSYKSR